MIKKSPHIFLTPLFDTQAHLATQSLPTTLSLSFAQHDFDIIRNFLTQYSGNKTTFEAYRRELERLTQWAWFIAKKSVCTLVRSDIETYISFCHKPPLTWIGTKRVARFIQHGDERIPNPAWRIFVVALSKSAFKANQRPCIEHFKLTQQAVTVLFTVLSSFYNYLLCENHATANPVAQIRQKSKYLRKYQSKRKIRRLSEVQWKILIETAKKMASQDPISHERTLFMITSCYLMYLRISELVATKRWEPQMGHFYQDSRGDWWFKTVSKGNKERDISVSSSMLEALKRYRRSRNLYPALPVPNEPIPLIHNLRTQQAITSDRPIRKMIQDCFDESINKLLKDGMEDEAKALEEATVHWLRHTGISDDINKRGRPIAHVRDDAGHSSSAVTDRYNDIELQERHDSAKNKKITI